MANTPSPCNRCKHLYYDATSMDDPLGRTYVDCKLGLPVIARSSCPDFVDDGHGVPQAVVRVWKYVLNHTSQSVGWSTYAFDIPVGAKVVQVGLDVAGDKELAIWAVVDPQQPTARRLFHVVATGQPVRGEYLGTVFNGQHVWHLFETTRLIA